MIIVTAARTASELGLFFGALSLFPAMPGFSRLMGMLAVLSFFTGLSHHFREKMPLRILFALANLAAALLWPAGAPLWGMVLSVGYCTVMSLAGRMDCEYYRYAKHMKFTLPAALVMVFAAGSVFGTGAWPTLVFGLIYFLCGTFALRQLRLGHNAPGKIKGMELLSLAALPVGAVSVLGALWGLSFPLSYLLRGILAGIAFVLQGITAIMSRLTAYTPQELADNAANMEGVILIPDSPGVSAVDSIPTESPNIRIPPNFWWILGGIAAAILIVYAAILVVKALKAPRLGSRTVSTRDEDQEAASAPAPRREPDSNRRRVRREYRRYLHLLRSRGFVRQDSDTSMDILNATEVLTVPEASRSLRGLYIRARYRTGETVTAGDVQEAKELYKKLKTDSGDHT